MSDHTDQKLEMKDRHITSTIRFQANDKADEYIQYGIHLMVATHIDALVNKYNDLQHDLKDVDKTTIISLASIYIALRAVQSIIDSTKDWENTKRGTSPCIGLFQSVIIDKKVIKDPACQS